MTNSGSAIAYIDGEYKNQMRDRIIRIEGWAAANDQIDLLEIIVNRQKLVYIDTCERSDVSAATGLPHAIGWNVYFEAQHYLVGNLNTLLVEVAINGAVIQRRYYRYDPRAKSTQPTIYFMHIPKTAGSSTRLALESDADVRLLPVYYQYPCLHEDQIATFSDAAFDDIDIVFGHYIYGLHKFSSRPYKYVSLVRHPIDHVISCYLYMKYIIGDERIVSQRSIFDAFDNVADATFDNYMTRYIAGYGGQEKIGALQFEQALANIHSDFAYIGTVEKYKESLEAISFYLGKELPYRVDNVTPASDEMISMDRREIEDRLGPRLVHDLKLYQAISERFPENFFFEKPPALLAV